jgi:hypothetical protein
VEVAVPLYTVSYEFHLLFGDVRKAESEEDKDSSQNNQMIWDGVNGA